MKLGNDGRVNCSQNSGPPAMWSVSPSYMYIGWMNRSPKFGSVAVCSLIAHVFDTAVTLKKVWYDGL